MTLDKLIGKGLQREPTSPIEIRRFLARIATKLGDAQSGTLSPGSQFDLAYEALLQIGLALHADELMADWELAPSYASYPAPLPMNLAP